ncbi:hypothetical protein FNF28_03200 [Cafeteria roenbergensis]|uniref:Response regulatory domain-containing protein n=2 Tax=Cafeteria roenbergensis TaxID=33653 RepID=A0A5A8DQN7_CAFRO|nr:hypothetical protein FNF28_03200 [Cafeteria roenbergensis]
MRQIDLAARSLEALPPSDNETVARNAPLALAAGALTSGDGAPFLGVSFSRALRAAEAPSWEAMVTRETGNVARVRNGKAASGRVGLVKAPTVVGQRTVPNVTLTTRGVLPHPSDRYLLGVVSGSISASELVSTWRRVAGGISHVDVLLVDVTSDTNVCGDVSGAAGPGGNRTSPAPVVLSRTCRDGSSDPFAAGPPPTALSPDLGELVRADTSDPITLNCSKPEAIGFAVVEGQTLVDFRNLALSAVDNRPEGELARQRLAAMCRQVESELEGRAGSRLRAQWFLEVAGRRWKLVAVASPSFEAASGGLSVALAVIMVVLSTLLFGGLAAATTLSLAAAAEREQRELHEASERLRISRNVHHTTVSYLAHEIRGGLTVTSVGAGLTAECLLDDGLRLPSGEVIEPDRLFGTGPGQSITDALATPASGEGDGGEGAVSAVALLRDLQRIQCASASSLLLIKDAFDVVALETGTLSVKLGRVQPREFVKTMADRYRLMSAVPIESQVDGDVPESLLMDPLRCEQVLLNGLTNAIKHTARGKIVLRVRMVNRPLGSAWYRAQSSKMNFFEQAAHQSSGRSESEIVPRDGFSVSGRTTLGSSFGASQDNATLSPAAPGLRALSPPGESSRSCTPTSRQTSREASPSRVAGRDAMAGAIERKPASDPVAPRTLPNARAARRSTRAARRELRTTLRDSADAKDGPAAVGEAGLVSARAAGPQRADAPEGSVAPGLEVLKGRAAGPLCGKLILVVDDEPMVLASTSRLLRRLGCDVVSTQNPDDAVRALAFAGQTSSSFHLARAASVRVRGSGAEARLAGPEEPGKRTFSAAFLDIVMPRRHGDDVARELRGGGCTTPLLAVTGNVTERDIATYRRCGFSGVLGKPLSKALVVSVLYQLGVCPSE